MSTAYSYPGIYIQEMPLSTKTITPTPTSIAAFVGYSHPWKTKAAFTNGMTNAIQLFSFSDFEANFGGLISSDVVAADLSRAVYAFFLNGGTNAWVVGLEPKAEIAGPTTVSFGTAADDLCYVNNVNPDNTNATVGIQFLALEPADTVPITVTISNLRKNSSSVVTIFDLSICYGSQVEVYRNMDISLAKGAAGSLDKTLNGVSQLVQVQPMSGTSYGTAFATIQQSGFNLMQIGSSSAPVISTTLFSSDFTAVFEQNSTLDNVEIFNLLLTPGVYDNAVQSAALAFAERKRAFMILDPPANSTASTGDSYQINNMITSMPLSQNGAIYFPYINATDPVSGSPMQVAPSGYVAGVFATTDSNRGVWKAPAGMAASVLGTTGPVAVGVMNDMQQGFLYSTLNTIPVNCLRSFSGAGTVVYGSRTLVGNNSAFEQSKYVPVRRMTLFIEQTLVANLKWVVFEPNDEPLWLAIKSSIEAFLLSLFNQGALQGSTPSDAFQVKCDATTTTSSDQQNGIVNIVIGVALLKPAEFVVIKLSQLAGQTS
jgi:phage tail sheath protein FI